ncbi:MAG TPA: hypothetical protein VH539_20430 [Gemmatimonadaceae bacterium]|jgi:hypothetical protein
MAEPITKLLVLQELQRLHTAFPSAPGMKNNPEGTAAIYCDGLHGLTADALRAAVKITIETEKYFPKVADLRSLAWEWTRRHSSDVTPELKNPLWCARCGTEARWLERWRPRIDPRTSAPVLSTDGQYIALERFERLLCHCAAPCAFTPELEFDEPWMLRSRVTQCIGARAGSGRPSRIAFTAPLSDERRAEMHRQLESAGAIAENMAAEALEHV